MADGALHITRDQLAAALSGNARAIRLVESLMLSVRDTLPQAADTAQQTADSAQAIAVSAQNTAFAGRSAADAAARAAAAAQDAADRAQAALLTMRPVDLSAILRRLADLEAIVMGA